MLVEWTLLSTVYVSWTEALHIFFLLCIAYKVLFSQQVLSVIWKHCLVLINFFSASHVGLCLFTLIKKLYKHLTCEIFSWPMIEVNSWVRGNWNLGPFSFCLTYCCNQSLNYHDRPCLRQLFYYWSPQLDCLPNRQPFFEGIKKIRKEWSS